MNPRRPVAVATPWLSRIGAILSPIFVAWGAFQWVRRNTPPPGVQFGDDADQP